MAAACLSARRPLQPGVRAGFEPWTDLREVARRLLRAHALRAADAAQLAAATLAAQHKPVSLTFVTLDARLAAAARQEGFPVLTPAA